MWRMIDISSSTMSLHLISTSIFQKDSVLSNSCLSPASVSTAFTEFRDSAPSVGIPDGATADVPGELDFEDGRGGALVPEGHVPVRVGRRAGGHVEWFAVRADLLGRPAFAKLLMRTAQEYRYGHPGAAP